ncbi:MAG: hypothetical protein J7L82_00160, partial [Staphylothermus sp.]|nr:hypothetical protein [Staphylothermus sp.]
NLSNIYYSLLSIDEETLLSEEHRKVLRDTINTVSKILLSLTKYRQLMIYIKNDPEQYREICLYSHDQLNDITQDAEQLLLKLARMLQDFNNLGSATCNLHAFGNTINNALYKETSNSNNQGVGNNQQNQTTGSGSEAGSGAGYHNLTETD